MWSIGGSAYGGGPSSWAEEGTKPAKRRVTTTPARSHMLASTLNLDIKLDYSVDVRISSAPRSIRSSRPAVAVPEVPPAEYDTRAN
jgi:hypothetical protein